jgi:iron-sulfur cluster repair protein YtfE (RIC family)
MNYNRLGETVKILLELIENFSLPRGKKNALKRALRIINEVKYTTNSMIDLEYEVQEIIYKENNKDEKKNEELLKKLSELFEVVRNPENWCL